MSATSDSTLVARPRPRQRAHRKSRLGCKICKERKIKCDEIRPVCGNCVRRFSDGTNECEYDEHDPPPRKPRYISSSDTSLIGSPSPSMSSVSQLGKSSIISPAARSLELRLFHHYSTITCHTLPLYDEAVGRQMWAVAVPKLSFVCPYVYSAMLSFAALHLLSSNPYDVAMEAAAYQYIDETIRALKQDMTNINSRNSINIFTTSAILTIQTKIRSHQVVKASTPYVFPTDYFHLHAGARQLFNKTKPYMQGSDIQAWIEWRPDHRFHISPQNDDTVTPYDWPSDPLFELWDTISETTVTPSRKSIYAGALAYVALLKQCITNKEPRHWVQRRFSILASEVPEEFLALLGERDPLAFVIMARVFALLKFVDGSWWLTGTAEYDIVGLSNMVGQEWLWAMEWPMQVVRSVGDEHQLGQMRECRSVAG